MLKDRIRSIRYAFVYWFVRWCVFVSTAIPRTLWLQFCSTLGILSYYIAHKSRGLTLNHISIAFPSLKPSEVRTLARRNAMFLAKNIGDTIRTIRVSTVAKLEQILVVHNYHIFETTRAKNKGIIFLSCHVGAFELQVTYMALRGLKPLLIGTPLKDKRLNDFLWNQRNAHGAIAIERGKETFRLIKQLKSGGTLAILIDQDTRVKSRFVNFFGRPASTPVGAAVLAIKTGAIVVPSYIYLGADGKHHMHFLEPIETTVTGDEEVDITVNTQRYTSVIEAVVRKHPEQWVWMHERWKTKPGEEIR